MIDIKDVIMNPDYHRKAYDDKLLARKAFRNETLEVILYERNKYNLNYNRILFMKIQYDKLADAMYIYFRKAKVSKTIKMKDRLIVDVDKVGKIIGLEILGVSTQIPKNQIGNIQMEMPVFAS